MPDKAARQINLGGWSGDSTFGVRLYTPNGVPGTNSTNDWEENFQELSLQRGRWYPSAAVLANGSIMVIGGEIGSNDKPEPNMEIVPKPVGGDTTVPLDWLARTDPNNLYPFVIILPSKNIFVGALKSCFFEIQEYSPLISFNGEFHVGYFNEARILEPVGFNTFATLPNIPGSVNNCKSSFNRLNIIFCADCY